jgi:hypothetical protein
VTCTAGSGQKVQAGVDARSGDTVVIPYSGCSYVNVVNGLATVTGGDGVPAASGGWVLKGTGSVTLTMVATGTFGQSIVYFTPTTAQSPDQTYVVLGTTSAAPSATPTPTPSATPSKPTSNVPDPNDPYAPIDPIVPPRIVGRMTVGSTIKIDIGKWKPMPFAYRTIWYRVLPDGTKVKVPSYQRNDQYLITPTDRGNRITAEVVAKHPSYQTNIFTPPRRVR